MMLGTRNEWRAPKVNVCRRPAPGRRGHCDSHLAGDLEPAVPLYIFVDLATGFVGTSVGFNEIFIPLSSLTIQRGVVTLRESSLRSSQTFPGLSDIRADIGPLLCGTPSTSRTFISFLRHHQALVVCYARCIMIFA